MRYASRLVAHCYVRENRTLKLTIRLRFRILVSLFFRGIHRIRRTSNNRRSHSTQCISREFEILQTERKSRDAETEERDWESTRALHAKNRFVFGARTASKGGEEEARDRTERHNGVPTRSLALREVDEIIDIGERPFWRVVSPRLSARSTHTHIYTRYRRPSDFKVRNTRTPCVPNALHARYPRAPCRHSRRIALYSAVLRRGKIGWSRA